jgi:hypothetical protein
MADLKSVLVLSYYSSFEALVYKQKGVRIFAIAQRKEKQDAEMIRHPADATQWRNIDSRNPKFCIDMSNTRITICTYDMNPFMKKSTHST